MWAQENCLFEMFERRCKCISIYTYIHIQYIILCILLILYELFTISGHI